MSSNTISHKYITDGKVRAFNVIRQLVSIMWILTILAVLSVPAYSVYAWIVLDSKSAIVGNSAVSRLAYADTLLDLKAKNTKTQDTPPFTTDVYEAKIFTIWKDADTLRYAIVNDAIEHGAYVSSSTSHRIVFVTDSEYRKRIEPLTHINREKIRNTNNGLDLYYGSWVREPLSRPDIEMSGKNTIYNIKIKYHPIERASTHSTLIALGFFAFALFWTSLALEVYKHNTMRGHGQN